MAEQPPSKELGKQLRELYHSLWVNYEQMGLKHAERLLSIIEALDLAPEPPAALQSVQTMFTAAVSSLAEISQALDIPDHVASVANGNAEILKAIAHLKRAAQPPGVSDAEFVAYGLNKFGKRFLYALDALRGDGG